MSRRAFLDEMSIGISKVGALVTVLSVTKTHGMNNLRAEMLILVTVSEGIVSLL